MIGLFLLLTVACQSGKNAQTLIDQAITAHGGDAWQGKQIEFDFRNFHLVLLQQGGQFRYERTHPDSTGTIIREVLTNDGLTRSLNGQPQVLDTAQAGKYSRAVNSVAYFVLLPFKLRDPAVLADYVGEATVDGQLYDKVRVRFRAEGGGKDHGDVFCYWFNQKTHTMDYLAYSEGGPRFRKAMNPQVVGGIRFQDYINYKGNPADTTASIRYDQQYMAKQLTELSRIENKNIRVLPIK
ncbi:hypothetical protein J2I47_06435 [Fibrella sp. HMF5335]|uniref:Deoxyribose-phosphate aldolase n=2 Tax=Fibrella rubiginis TaxID=2817060 RepID=A0A939GE94_9BACT|nr:hypothetical protein [Fibrella rubiginis]